MKTILTLGLLAIFTVFAACSSDRANHAPAPAAQPAPAKHLFPTMGSVERLDPTLDQIIATHAEIEKLAGGFKWAEGPVWVKSGNYLLFSDIPRNVIFRWKEDQPTKAYLEKSGYTGSVPRQGEMGSNGLTIDSQGRLVLCAHGDRAIVRIEPGGNRTYLARYYRWQRFNSPNDLVYKSNGNLYFTDPSYGLEKRNDDPAKELPFNGVFRLSRNGEVTLLTSELSYPNGIAFSPDEKILYVSVSDPGHAVWMAYSVKKDGTLGEGRVFLDSTAEVKGNQGVPDGMKVDKRGNLFATGPGGVWIISPEGKHLGTIHTGEATANCAFGNDGSVLYMTANMYLCRIKTLTKGEGF